MADIEKPDLTNKWAEEGAVIKPTDAKIRLGWTSEVPPHQWQNWWQQRVDSSLSYSLQKGIPEWNEEAEYIANKSFVQFGGDIYKCIQTNTGENPSSKPAYWKPLRDVYSEELELGSASRVDMGTGGTQIRTNSQNDSRYIQGGSVTQSTGSSTTNVMSQKAATEALNTKADKSTTISAGIGLEGGGNLSANRTLSVKYGTSAGTAVQGNDSRVVNALQRGNNLSDVTNPAAARGNLGLGSAATREVVSSDTDTSGGNKVVTQGWMGLGAHRLLNDNSATSRFSYYGPDSFPLNYPADWWDYGAMLAINHGYGGSPAEIVIPSHSTNQIIGFRGRQSQELRELYHTGNILKSTGNNDEYPMSQKAVTDAINNSSIGVGQTWQDVTSQRASGTTYTNTTGRPILVFVVADMDGQSNMFYVDDVGFIVDFPSVSREHYSIIIPAGSTYRVVAKSIIQFLELR